MQACLHRRLQEGRGFGLRFSPAGHKRVETDCSADQRGQAFYVQTRAAGSKCKAETGRVPEAGRRRNKPVVGGADKRVDQNRITSVREPRALLRFE